ncbi:MAG: UvrD-helicase domain-containing protein [Armatimonadota bacterium]
MAHELRFIGPPGCGKTTRMTQCVRQAADRYGPENVLICSLTKAAGSQAALALHEQGVPVPDRNVGTLHSFAYRSLQLGQDQIADTPKRLKEWNAFVEAERRSYFRISSATADLDEGAAENSWGGETLGDRCFGQYQISRARCLPVETLDETGQAFVALWEQFKSDCGLYDFTDLLGIALRDTLAAPENPRVLFVDEAQDTSMLGMRLLRSWAEEAAYLLIFGDPLQNLFAWAGTDSKAFTTPDVPDSHKHVLSQSYRVPRAVHAQALRWIEPLKRELEAELGKAIEYFPRPEEGELRRLGSAHFKYPEPAVNDAERYLAAGKTVMFQAACAHMLEPLLMVLRKRGIPFHNPWRTKRSDWNPLGARRGKGPKARLLSFLRLCAEVYGSDAAVWTPADLWNWLEVCEASGLLLRGAKKAVQEIAAVEGAREPLTASRLLLWFEADALTEALEASEAANLEWLLKRALPAKKRPLEFPAAICKKLGPAALLETPRVIVGTIHSLKGSQADVTYVFPDLSRAGMDEWCRGGAARAGIVRMFYVAMTRPEESLVLCGQASPFAVAL